HGAVQPGGGEVGLAVDVQDGARRAGRIGREQGSLEELVRVTFHQVAVLEDAGLAFLAVDDEVLGLPDGMPAGLPLGGGRKERAAPPLEARGLHGLDQLERRTAEGAGERPVRAADERVVLVFRVYGAAPGHEYEFLDNQAV